MKKKTYLALLNLVIKNFSLLSKIHFEKKITNNKP